MSTETEASRAYLDEGDLVADTKPSQTWKLLTHAAVKALEALEQIEERLARLEEKR